MTKYIDHIINIICARVKGIPVKLVERYRKIIDAIVRLLRNNVEALIKKDVPVHRLFEKEWFKMAITIPELRWKYECLLKW